MYCHLYAYTGVLLRNEVGGRGPTKKYQGQILVGIKGLEQHKAALETKSLIHIKPRLYFKFCLLSGTDDMWLNHTFTYIIT